MATGDFNAITLGANLTGTDLGGGTIEIAATGGGGGGFSPTGPHRFGATENRWFCAGQANGTAFTNNAHLQDTLVAIPFSPSKDMDLEGLAIGVTTGAGSSAARVGVYDDDGNGYPNALLHEVTPFSTVGIGIKSETGITGVALTGGALYWAAFVTNGSAGMRSLAVAGCWPVPGTNGLSLATGPAAVAWTSGTGGYTYAALADPFPASYGGHTSAIPAVFVLGV